MEKARKSIVHRGIAVRPGNVIHETNSEFNGKIVNQTLIKGLKSLLVNTIVNR